jgi:hypothetical protein
LGRGKFALDVEVADTSGRSAEFVEELAGLLCGPGVLRQIGEKCEEFELSFDAAGGGAEVVDRFGLGIGECKSDGGFEGGDQVAQGEDGMSACGWHVDWMLGLKIWRLAPYFVSFGLCPATRIP